MGDKPNPIAGPKTVRPHSMGPKIWERFGSEEEPKEKVIKEKAPQKRAPSQGEFSDLEAYEI